MKKNHDTKTEKKMSYDRKRRSVSLCVSVSVTQSKSSKKLYHDVSFRYFIDEIFCENCL